MENHIDVVKSNVPKSVGIQYKVYNVLDIKSQTSLYFH